MPNRRVLVVDDEPLITSSVSRALRRGHEVECAANGRDALRLIRAGERFDVILCDLSMPELGGIEVYRQLCTLAPEQAARIVFLTGGLTDDEAAFIEEAGRPCIEKPFSLQQLRETMVEFGSAELAGA